MNFRSYLFPQVINKESSKYNQKIEIVDFFGRKSLRVDGLTQSGSIVEDIYRNVFPELKKTIGTKKINDVLILGLGGGSFAKLCRLNFPQALIMGIEIDRKIISLSKAYLGLSQITGLKIICQDAIYYIKRHDIKKKYDLIFADLYFGREISPELEDPEFIAQLKELLTTNGVLIFNRFNWGKFKRKNEEFIKMLRSVFKEIRTQKSYSNLLVFAYS